MEPRGLGDTIENFTKATGIKKLADALEFFNLTSDADMRRIANGINDAIIANPGGSIVDVKGYVLSNYEITNP